MSIIDRLRRRKNDFPYTVVVSKEGTNDVNVTVLPPPIATKDEYLTIVTGTFTRILTDTESLSNTPKGRETLRKKIVDALETFHRQGMIRPVEESDRAKKKEEAN